ncbi:hypothetical protein SPRG_11785 [Saprolegnia parasitica CBS 223.65]|uniref:Carbonic anhydrase n=1 Tax=Saprolegnia parasitica (strain CBS 223.65) TaxID=695850 RepID=A0A067C8R2_SAPPC|nr:hypothetical protein SPRG_11785 [Saprolegnia parasitica CBS 223.65]KDO22941.1 hypothetical protein SPRG_11785 [Saprolegnia parasitica CBS 223.65]|eukprot:XP_012206377.1 hypothetical protein SPRG_11785 [Saprolegnia parasitica CBS 223.65]
MRLFSTTLLALAAAVAAVCPDPELKSQSPIDFPKLDPTLNKQNVTMAFPNAANGVMIHEGDTIKVKWDGGKDASFALNAKTYKTAQFHFHAPSEHTVRGYQYPFEMHIVHQADDKSLAVIGILFEEGPEDNAFLKGFWPSIKHLGDVHSNVSVANVNAAPLKLTSASSVYRYSGSLTTPPYTEGVEWTVVTAVQKMSKAQLQMYKEKIHEDSARPVQPLFGRKVTLFQSP